MLKKFGLGLLTLLLIGAFVLSCGEYPISLAPTSAEIYLNNGAVQLKEGGNAYLIGTSSYRELAVSFNYEFSNLEVEIDFEMSGGLEDFGLNITETHTSSHPWSSAPYGRVGQERNGQKDSPFKFTPTALIDSIKINTNNGAPGTAQVVIKSIKVDGQEIDIDHTGLSFGTDYVWVPGSKTPGGGEPPKAEFGALVIDRTTFAVPGTSEHGGGSLVYELTAAEKTLFDTHKDKEFLIEVEWEGWNWWDQYRVILGLTNTTSSYDGLNFGWVNAQEQVGGGGPKPILYKSSGTISDIAKVQYLIFHRSSNQALSYDPDSTGSGNDRVLKFNSIKISIADTTPRVFSANNLGPNVAKNGTVLAEKFDTGIQVRGRTANSGLVVITDANGLGLDIMKRYSINVRGRLLGDPDGDETVSLQPMSSSSATKGGDIANVELSGSSRDFNLTGTFYYPEASFTGASAFDNLVAYAGDASNYGIRIATDKATDFFVSSITIDWLPTQAVPVAPENYTVTLNSTATLGGGWGLSTAPFPAALGLFFEKATLTFDLTLGSGGGENALRLKLTNGGGNYDDISIPYSLDGSAAGVTKASGAPHFIQLAAEDTSYEVKVTLDPSALRGGAFGFQDPVAGTAEFKTIYFSEKK